MSNSRINRRITCKNQGKEKVLLFAGRPRPLASLPPFKIRRFKFKLPFFYTAGNFHERAAS